MISSLKLLAYMQKIYGQESTGWDECLINNVYSGTQQKQMYGSNIIFQKDLKKSYE